MKQITIVTQTSNAELYNFLCSKYRDYAVMHNNKELKGFKVVPLLESELSIATTSTEVENVEQ